MRGFDQLSPAPETFRAGINRGSHAKSTLVTRIDNDSIEQERLSSTVLARDADYTDWLIDS